MSDNSREFDIVVFGASGFVGALTAAYLAEHAPDDTRVALAGRNRDKLARVRDALPAAARDWPLLIADVESPSTLDAMAARTQVICTTVGPYLKYGENLLAAAVTAGTDYVDLTGEVPFVRWSIDKFGDQAAANGCRIVHSCGFDSIPSDVGVYLLYRAIEADNAGSDGDDDKGGDGKTNAGQMTDTTMVVKSMRGGASGGTIDSMRVISDLARDTENRRILLDPHALSGPPHDGRRTPRSAEPSDIAIRDARKVDPSLQGTLAPFFMSSHNTRIVRRTDVLLDNAYGPDFHYGEAMAVGKTPVLSTVAASLVSAGTGVFLGAMALPPTRFVLDKVLPKPGDGPDEKSREKGYFVCQTFTRTTTGRRYRSQVSAKGDPGYKATAVMLGESALTLALDRAKLPDRHGILTPVAAMGDALVDRLRMAGMTLRAERLD
ncbi:saccharopine dehydrogenase family protein [Williamsia sterculiae]|uniref:Uncharacterized conserved protein n=1 Tax=Williamsia sterculiae TaxID=1344003 RepID=A0A1N7D246_9NOCA|nr:saccharopine dehydrogenase NADP-binding domain-containing protein [Williamsia sterculiae]SIR69784.1 Uncharacterized conserved protein [Williamsia sterculiae]